MSELYGHTKNELVHLIREQDAEIERLRLRLAQAEALLLKTCDSWLDPEVRKAIREFLEKQP